MGMLVVFLQQTIHVIHNATDFIFLICCTGALCIQASPRFWQCPPSSLVCQPLCHRCLTSKLWTSTCGQASCLSSCLSSSMLLSTISPRWRKWRSSRGQRSFLFMFLWPQMSPFTSCDPPEAHWPQSITLLFVCSCRRSPTLTMPLRLWLSMVVSMTMKSTWLPFQKSPAPQIQRGTPSPEIPQSPDPQKAPGYAGNTLLDTTWVSSWATATWSTPTPESYFPWPTCSSTSFTGVCTHNINRIHVFHHSTLSHQQAAGEFRCLAWCLLFQDVLGWRRSSQAEWLSFLRDVCVFLHGCFIREELQANVFTHSTIFHCYSRVKTFSCMITVWHLEK